LLKPLLHRILPDRLQLVDSAQATARDAAAALGVRGASSGRPGVQFFATDSVEKFQLLGSRFLQREIDRVALITLPE
jgi:glutamate racemase